VATINTEFTVWIFTRYVTFGYLVLQFCLSSSVTFVHPTQPVEIFAPMFLRHFVVQRSNDHHAKLYEDRPGGIPTMGWNAKGVGLFWLTVYIPSILVEKKAQLKPRYRATHASVLFWATNVHSQHESASWSVENDWSTTRMVSHWLTPLQRHCET